MIYTRLTEKALKIAYSAHHGQADREGLPYIHHPLHLAEQMQTEDACVVALLHDVVEDTDISIDDLRSEGFTEEQLTAIKYLTHNPKDDYFEYVLKIRENDLARTVKLADLRHNMDITRLSKVTEKDLKRVEKYKKAEKLLLE